ncbi:MAG: hypothetical protein ACK4RM_11415, partial [Flavobacterium sp.]
HLTFQILSLNLEWCPNDSMSILDTHSTYPKVAVQWLNHALCIYQSFCLVDSVVLRNPLLRQAPKRQTV